MLNYVHAFNRWFDVMPEPWRALSFLCAMALIFAAGDEMSSQPMVIIAPIGLALIVIRMLGPASLKRKAGPSS